MISKIKYKIGRWMLSKNYRQRNNNTVTFNRFFKKSKEIFLILPDQEEYLSSSFDVLNYMNFLEKKVTVLINVKFSGIFQSQFNNKMITYSLEDKNYFGLPVKKLTDRISEAKFDIIIDLDMEETLFSPAVCNTFISGVKITLNKKTFGDYYNIVFVNNSNDTDYNNFIESIKMF